MFTKLKLTCLLLLYVHFTLLGENCLLHDLEIARYWDEKNNARLPVSFSHILSSGYFTTPSARMSCEGEIGFGIAQVPPYLLINGRIQPFSHFELSLSYRIFCGIEDPTLSKKGFGDFADRGANFKIALMTPEDSFYILPGIAFGAEDFMGTKRFENYYLVATQVWLNRKLEASFGWGMGRFSGPSLGFFGGAIWYPYWNTSHHLLQGLGIAAEYDPIDYEDIKKEPHPYGNSSHCPINFGVKYRLWNILDFSASSIRGEAFAWSGSFHYNWGTTKGFLPKIRDPCPYTAPRDTEPIGCYRPETVMIQNLNFVFEEQGFQLTKAWIEKKGSISLWINVMNLCYRDETVVRSRLEHILSQLAPSNVDIIIVTMESYGLPCQSYVFPRSLLERYCSHTIDLFEFDLLTRRREAVHPDPECAHLLYYRNYDLWRFRLSPRLETFFGSASGKFKYDFGVRANLDGFFPGDVYYETQVSYTLLSTTQNIADFDTFHPSQLPNVGTDYIRYRQSGNFTFDKAYLQKSWNWGSGFFSRAAGGYFQVNYAGVAGELLWYPARSCLAIGLEGAVVKKRSYHGFGFQSSLRQFEGTTPTYHPYTVLSQYFLDFYFDFPSWQFFTKIGIGQFLARDKGVKLSATRYFDSGLRLTAWITVTDAHDVIHGKNFYNRGFAIELPMDLLYKYSSRRVWSYGAAAWLRDAGYTTSTGMTLFEILNRERRL